MLLHWYGVEPGGWTMTQYFERLERIEDIRDMTEPVDTSDPDYHRRVVQRMAKRKARGI